MKHGNDEDRNEDAPMMIPRLDQRGRILKCDFDYQDELRF